MATIDLSEFLDLPPETRISIRIASGELTGTEIDNVPFSVLASPSPAESRRVQFLLEDCASYIDALHQKHKTPRFGIGIDTATVREAAASITPSPQSIPVRYVSIGHSFDGWDFGAITWREKPTDDVVREAYAKLFPRSVRNLNFEVYLITGEGSDQ